MPASKKRPLRADAERNRKHVLAVADEVFAKEGVAVPIDEIAKRAGLGVGTLYRHFPTKESLIEAILVDRMERMNAYLAKLEGEKDAGDAFFEFLGYLVATSGQKKDLMDALGPSFAIGTELQEAKRIFRESFAAVLARAQKAGAVRRDVELADVWALVHGLFSVHRGDARARALHLRIVSDGLRAHVRPSAKKRA